MFLLKTVSLLFIILNIFLKCLAYTDINTLLQNNIETSIDSSIDACEDFYSYACGDYGEQHRSNYYQEITTFMDYKFNTFILNLMESVYQHDHQVPEHCQTFVEKARIYLKSCRRETQRDIKRYFEELKPASNLEWPIWEKNDWPGEEEFNVWSLLGKLQSYGLTNVLIHQVILVQKDDSFIIKMEPAYMETNTTLPDIQTLKFLLMALKAKDPKKDLNGLKKTNRQLIELYDNYEESSEEEEIFYKDLNENLKIFIKELLKRDIAPYTLVTLRNPDYFKVLNEDFLQQFDLRNLCNYLMLKFLYFLAEDSTKEFKSLDCVEDLRNKMDLAVNFLYYHHEYSLRAEEYNADLSVIHQNLFLAFKKLFQKNNLNFTLEQQDYVLSKLSQMRLNIGNLPLDVSFKKVEEFYKNIPPLDKNNYYKNHLLLLEHRFARSLVYAQNQTYYIVPDNHQGSSSGAFYINQQNMIILPFGSLTIPFYNASSHDLYKYSLLGFVLAHESAHAFDTTGLCFDAFGQRSTKDCDILKNQNFLESIECLQSQLPTDSIDERIADIVAIDVAYNAYIERFKDLQPLENGAIWNKLFYLNLAQFFCGKSNVKFIDHDADADRLNEIVANSEGFAIGFGCARNSTMNRLKRCKIY